jgi:hypothetical protein
MTLPAHELINTKRPIETKRSSLSRLSGRSDQGLLGRSYQEHFLGGCNGERDKEGGIETCREGVARNSSMEGIMGTMTRKGALETLDSREGAPENN